MPTLQPKAHSTTSANGWCIPDSSLVRENGDWSYRHHALLPQTWTKHGDPLQDWKGWLSPGCGAPGAAVAKAFSTDTLRSRSEAYRTEFKTLSEKWYRETRHLSLVAKKITHPAYLRIIGMGEPVIPLLLEALRDRPSHWFVALQATSNENPSPENCNPSQAREAWLAWGRFRGLVE